ncbi:MAG: YciI family protein [Acidimicrobiales bacterium]
MAIFVVATEKGPNWDHDRDIREQRDWAEHALFADELVERGVIIFGGPISDANDTDIALLAVEAGDEAELRTIFSDDPWMLSGVFRIKDVRSWTWWLDSRKAPPATH